MNNNTPIPTDSSDDARLGNPPVMPEGLGTREQYDADMTKRWGSAFYKAIQKSKSDNTSFVFDAMNVCFGADESDDPEMYQREADEIDRVLANLPANAPAHAGDVLLALQRMFQEAAHASEDYLIASGQTHQHEMDETWAVHR